MESDSSQLSGARQIVQRCLGLTSDLASIIAEAAEQLAIESTIIFVPVSVQRQIPGERQLSLLAQEAAKEAWAILNCVNFAAECIPFRKFILENQWNARTKVGHMLGENRKVLELANVDFNRLTADNGGWERLPVASAGIISHGVWGNVPSGETYNGSINVR